MVILFLGDVVARSGREAVQSRLKGLQRETNADLTVINGENAAHGKGITSGIYLSLMEAGADVITLGNHSFSKQEILVKMDRCPNLLRPANMEPRNAGRAWTVLERHGLRVAVINLLGCVFMEEADNDPFDEMNRILAEVDADIILVDLHAEATSEKELFWQVFRDRVTAVIGTHTHVQTADEQIHEGSAYISDAGMCGPFNSVLGRDTAEVVERVLNKRHTRYTPSEEKAVLCGVVIEIDDDTHRAVSIRRIQERP